MDVTGFTTIVNGVKTTIDAVKKALEIKTDVAVSKSTNEVFALLNDVQEKLLALHSEHTAITRLKDDMESKLIALVQWQEDKARYELHRLPSGSFVYRIKPDCQETEPEHNLCPNCYNNNVKSILQFGGYQDAHSTLQCLNPTCRATVLNQRLEQKAYAIPNPIKRGAF